MSIVIFLSSKLLDLCISMEVLILTYIATAVLAITFMGFLLWGLRRKQFDDDYAPPRRILFDNDKPEEK